MSVPLSRTGFPLFVLSPTSWALSRNPPSPFHRQHGDRCAARFDQILQHRHEGPLSCTNGTNGTHFYNLTTKKLPNKQKKTQQSTKWSKLRKSLKTWMEELFNGEMEDMLVNPFASLQEIEINLKVIIKCENLLLSSHHSFACSRPVWLWSHPVINIHTPLRVFVMLTAFHQSWSGFGKANTHEGNKINKVNK